LQKTVSEDSEFSDDNSESNNSPLKIQIGLFLLEIKNMTALMMKRQKAAHGQK
jgi:hypothetical protein